MTQNQGAVSTEADGTLVDLLPAEEALFAAFGSSGNEPRPIFIVGAPRTGSTVLYQVMAHYFGLPYIANITNDYFSETPIVGLTLQKTTDVSISIKSQFGKTEGAFQPSEGSSVMKGWFGGGHPSQIVSNKILPEREPHFIATMSAVEALYEKPLMIKNAWNCFRVPYLARTFENARFIWIRRDITKAATSDLEARYIINGSANVWNSATPSKVNQLKKSPPEIQVVENQYEFNKAIGDNLNAYAGNRYVSVWYEDLIANTADCFSGLGDFLGETPVRKLPSIKRGNVRDYRLKALEIKAIVNYVKENEGHLMTLQYANASPLEGKF